MHMNEVRRVVDEERLLPVSIDKVDGEFVDNVGAIHLLIVMHLLAVL